MRQAVVVAVLLAGLVGCGDEAAPQRAVAPITASDCPGTASVTPAVPAEPDGVRTEKRKVVPSEAEPAVALVCRYAASGPEDRRPLVEGRLLDGGLDGVPRLLAAFSGCLAGGPGGRPTDERAPHLLRLGYETGSLWVASTDGDCLGTTNGETTVTDSAGGFLAESFDTGRFGGQGAPAACRAPVPPATRTELVPPGWASVTACGYLRDQTREVGAAAARQVADLLARVPVERVPESGGSHACATTLVPGSRYANDADTYLRFAYPGGDAVGISLQACGETLFSSPLSATLPAAVQLRLRELVGLSR